MYRLIAGGFICLVLATYSLTEDLALDFTCTECQGNIVSLREVDATKSGITTKDYYADYAFSYEGTGYTGSDKIDLAHYQLWSRGDQIPIVCSSWAHSVNRINQKPDALSIGWICLGITSLFMGLPLMGLAYSTGRNSFASTPIGLFCGLFMGGGCAMIFYFIVWCVAPCEHNWEMARYQNLPHVEK